MTRRPARVSVVTQPGKTQFTDAVEPKPCTSTTGSPSPSSSNAIPTSSRRNVCIAPSARGHRGEAQTLARYPRTPAFAVSLGGPLGRALDGRTEAEHHHHRAEQPGCQRKRARREQERPTSKRLEDGARART